MPKITVIGSNMYELTTYTDHLPHRGETIEAQDFAEGFGGKGANQAVAAARLGADVTLLTVVGNDYFGRQQQQNYTDNRIQSAGILVGHQGSGVASIFVESTGANRILIVTRANNELTPAVIDAHLDLIKNTQLIVLQQEINLVTNYHVIEMANKYHIPVMLNPAPANLELDINYVTKVTFFTPNEHELATITGLPTYTQPEIKAAGQTLIDAGVQNLFITQGRHGVLWMDQHHSEQIAALPVMPVDTTGAGDAFAGSFAYYYTAGAPIGTAIKLANQYAAISVTRYGTQTAYPTKYEMRKMDLPFHFE